MEKEIFSTIAIGLTFYAFFPYILSIIKGRTRPHVFSWIIWGSTTFIVFLAQLSDDGGAGAWPIGFSGLVTIFVAYLAYQVKSDISITKSDWIFLVAALLSLPIWYLTDNPVWAVILLTTIDIIGFGPTIRKTYYHPNEENPQFYAIFVLRNLFAIFALENYSLTTVLFPLVTGIASFLLVTLILLRRDSDKNATNTD